MKKREELLLKARNTVYNLLRFRLRSEKEILEKLKAKKLPASIIGQTAEHFKEIGLINDEIFARRWTASRLKKPFGLNRIRLELKKKGVRPDVIDATILEATKDFDELEVVKELARYRALKYKNIDPEKIRQRVYSYLQRRGFNMNTIIKAIKNL